MTSEYFMRQAYYFNFYLQGPQGCMPTEHSFPRSLTITPDGGGGGGETFIAADIKKEKWVASSYSKRPRDTQIIVDERRTMPAV